MVLWYFNVRHSRKIFLVFTHFVLKVLTPFWVRMRFFWKVFFLFFFFCFCCSHADVDRANRKQTESKAVINRSPSRTPFLNHTRLSIILSVYQPNYLTISINLQSRLSLWFASHLYCPALCGLLTNRLENDNKKNEKESRNENKIKEKKTLKSHISNEFHG